jgi:plasmid stabilization system protein ParE
MKQYEVLISEKASEDMDCIYKHIAEVLHEPVIAANQYDRIADAILTLEQLPDRIKLMSSEPERSNGLRPLYVDNYTVFFVIKADTVLIVRVLYSSSDISAKLAEE